MVSGLARGIDTAAHVGALAGRHDRRHRQRHRHRLSARKCRACRSGSRREGLLIAEQPPGTEPLASHFPSRNRIIAGLALGTVVVEAAPKSGSLITARIAAELGREVMAVPGSPLDPRAHGCNQLIREGATLVQTAADVLEQVRPIDARAVAQPVDPFEPGPPTRLRIPTCAPSRDLLGPTPVPGRRDRSPLRPAERDRADRAARTRTGGRLERHAGGKVSLID